MREPTLADVQSIASHYGLSLSRTDLEGHLGWVAALVAAFTVIDDTPLVGRRWEEATIYRAAHALEQSGDWREWQASE